MHCARLLREVARAVRAALLIKPGGGLLVVVAQLGRVLLLEHVAVRVELLDARRHVVVDCAEIKRSGE